MSIDARGGGPLSDGGTGRWRHSPPPELSGRKPEEHDGRVVEKRPPWRWGGSNDCRPGFHPMGDRCRDCGKGCRCDDSHDEPEEPWRPPPRPRPPAPPPRRPPKPPPEEYHDDEERDRAPIYRQGRRVEYSDPYAPAVPYTPPRVYAYCCYPIAPQRMAPTPQCWTAPQQRLVQVGGGGYACYPPYVYGGYV